MSCKQLRALIRLCQVKSHVQTACESHDLNMASNSFGQQILCARMAITGKSINAEWSITFLGVPPEHGFKQLRAANSMLEWLFQEKVSTGDGS